MVQHITLSRDHRSIGLGHGRAAAPTIRRTVEFYRQFLSSFSSDAAEQAERLAQHFRTVISTQSPHLATEIEAIAEGAGLEPIWLFMLNARSELLSHSVPECTALYSPQSGVLAQTWDFAPQLQDSIVLLEIREETGLQIFTATEAGMVGKVGMNSRGLGVCLNMLMTEKSLAGLPIHVLLREFMQCESLDAVRAKSTRFGAERSGNVMIGTAHDGGLNIEYLGTRTQADRVLDSSFVHTNHPLGAPLPDGELYENSLQRLTTAQSIAGSRSNLSLSEVNRILSDQSDGRHPVCAPFRILDGYEVGTLLTVIMELGAGKIHLRKGPDPAADYTTFELETAPSKGAV